MIFILFIVYVIRTGLNYFLVGEIWREADYPVSFFNFNHVIEVVLGELYVIGFVTAIKLLVSASGFQL